MGEKEGMYIISVHCEKNGGGEIQEAAHVLKIERKKERKQKPSASSGWRFDELRH
jgi:hypothetical protein